MKKTKTPYYLIVHLDSVTKKYEVQYGYLVEPLKPYVSFSPLVNVVHIEFYFDYELLMKDVFYYQELNEKK